MRFMPVRLLVRVQLQVPYINLQKEGVTMFWTIFFILLVLWLLGLLGGIGGDLIYILLVAALVILVYNLVTKQRGP